MNKLILLAILGILSCKEAPKLPEIKINEIKVLDDTFKIVNIIKDSNQINELKSLIGNNYNVNNLPTPHKWNYKLDVESNQYSGRWLYDTIGILSRLNYQLKPSYKITDNQKFNNLLLQK